MVHVMSEVKRYEVKGKFESTGPEGISLLDPKMVLEDDYDAKCHAADVYFGSWKRTEQELDAQRLRADTAEAELADMQHWRDLALQFDNHRMTALGHLRAVVRCSDRDLLTSAEEFLKEPPLAAHEVVAKLDAAEQRNAELKHELELSERSRIAMWRRSEEMTTARDCIATNYNQLSYGATACKEKLASAEQHIAELTDLIEKAHTWVDRNNFGGWDAYELRDQLAAALNPNPEAESHG